MGIRKPEEPRNLSFDSSHAFVIGIDHYRNVSELSTPVNDAEGIAARLSLPAHGYRVHKLLDGEATSEGIRRLLAETMPAVVGEKDRVLFYFAGHGIALDGEEGPEGYLAPVDAGRSDTATLISMTELNDALARLPCRHGLLILDCCFAGAFKWSTGFRDAAFDLPKVIYQQRFQQYLRDPAWQVITSAASDQKAVDLIDNRSLGLREEEGEHSPFALALFKALEGEADVVPKGERADGVITAVELYAYLRDWVEDQTTLHASRQTPSLFSLKRHDKGQYVFLDPRNPLNLPPEPDRNPYQGLTSFTEADADLFYGRDRVETELMEKLAAHRLVVVTGPTGSGKTSVLQAGLIPRLRAAKWTVLPVIRPGTSPLDILDGMAVLNGDHPVDAPTVLIVDQFEQLITDNPDAEAAETFEARLAGYLQRRPGLRLVIGIRSDFELFYSARSPQPGEPEAMTAWRGAWAAGRYFLPPLTKGELREAIEKPATQKIMFFEPASLVQRLVDEVYMAPGALPMLSYALSELYLSYQSSGRTDRTLTETDYETMGGLIGALQRRADQIYQSLGEEEKKVMRHIVLRMMKMENSGIVRRKVPYVKGDQIPAAWEKDELGGWQYRQDSGELIRIHHELDYPRDQDDRMIARVLEKLELDARLVVITTDEATGQSYVEPVHDALVTFWPAARQWVREWEDRLVLQRQLWQAAVEYRAWTPPLLSYGNAESASPPLWDTNPKLQQVQLAVTDPKDEWLCQKGWGDKDISSVAFLLWEEEPADAQLAELRQWGDYAQNPAQSHPPLFQAGDTPQQLFRRIRAQMDGWLNETELNFIRKSFDKRRDRLEELKRRLEEMTEAKDAAEAARQRTVNEMIEASWKAGTYLQETDKTGVEGVRDLHAKLKLLMSLEKAQSLSPVPIFSKGPHQHDFDLASDHFGYYNPEFLAWARKCVIPAKNNGLLRRLTQPFYDTYLKDMARIYFLTYRQLNHDTDLRDRVKMGYMHYIETGEMTQNWVNGSSGGIFFENQFGAQVWPHLNEIETLAHLELNNPYYHWVVSLGFWIRRCIDGTAEGFKDILDDLLGAYDPDWVRNPPELPFYYAPGSKPPSLELATLMKEIMKLSKVKEILNHSGVNPLKIHSKISPLRKGLHLQNLLTTLEKEFKHLFSEERYLLIEECLIQRFQFLKEVCNCQNQ